MWYTFDITLEGYEYLNRLSEFDEIKKEDLETTLNDIANIYWENNNIKYLKIAIQQLSTIYGKYRKVKFENIVEFFNWLDEKDLTNTNKIVISTLHQSKGREFNSVILCFDDEFDRNNLWNKEEQYRRYIYVWITRARHNLIVLGNNRINFFNDLWRNSRIKEEKTDNFDNKRVIIDRVTRLSDVILGCNFHYDRNKKNYHWIWEPLTLADNRLNYNWTQIVMFSNEFKASIDRLKNRWYKMKDANVYQRIVYNLKEKWTYKRVMIYLAKVRFEKL